MLSQEAAYTMKGNAFKGKQGSELLAVAYLVKHSVTDPVFSFNAKYQSLNIYILYLPMLPSLEAYVSTCVKNSIFQALVIYLPNQQLISLWSRKPIYFQTASKICILKSQRHEDRLSSLTQVLGRISCLIFKNDSPTKIMLKWYLPFE